MGTFYGGTRETTQLAAVFSRDARLLSSTERHRVPGAIDAGEDHVSSGTFWRKQRNDIPEDFNVNEIITVTIPAGATRLFIAPPDSLFDDNEDPDGDFGRGSRSSRRRGGRGFW